jgi:hypothetical protein
MQGQPPAAVAEAVKKRKRGWITEYGNETYAAGAKQLAKYFGTGKYKRAYLIVFDCGAAKGRKSESKIANSSDVSPHNPANFRILRACVDPRKASKSSKAK